LETGLGATVGCLHAIECLMLPVLDLVPSAAPMLPQG
jgi:hypothetical protein